MEFVMAGVLVALSWLFVLAHDWIAHVLSKLNWGGVASETMLARGVRFLGYAFVPLSVFAVMAGLFQPSERTLGLRPLLTSPAFSAGRVPFVLALTAWAIWHVTYLAWWNRKRHSRPITPFAWFLKNAIVLAVLQLPAAVLILSDNQNARLTVGLFWGVQLVLFYVSLMLGGMIAILENPWLD